VTSSDRLQRMNTAFESVHDLRISRLRVVLAAKRHSHAVARRTLDGEYAHAQRLAAERNFIDGELQTLSDTGHCRADDLVSLVTRRDVLSKEEQTVLRRLTIAQDQCNRAEEESRLAAIEVRRAMEAKRRVVDAIKQRMNSQRIGEQGRREESAADDFMRAHQGPAR